RDGALEAVGHRQECEQDDHHQCDRDHRREREPAPLRDALEIDGGDRRHLKPKRTHAYPRPSAVAILSRMALSAGMIPVISPSAIISATPCSTMVGDTAKAGATLARLLRSVIAMSAAIARPGLRPRSDSTTDSPRT